MKQIKVIIENGKVTIDLDGYPEMQCMKDLEKVMEELKKQGLEVELRDKKDKPGGKVKVMDSVEMEG
jgi:prolyl-tRNA synthetase